MIIINEDDVVVFDEIGWGNIKFNTNDFAKDLLANHSHLIYQIDFLSFEHVIVIRTLKEDAYGSSIDYWFRDVDADLLDFFCLSPRFYIPIKRFFIRGRFLAFSVEKYPLL